MLKLELKDMRFEEKEEFILENAMLVSRTFMEERNVFIYWADSTFYKVTASPFTGKFEKIETVKEADLPTYFSSGEKRDLFFQPFSAN